MTSPHRDILVDHEEIAQTNADLHSIIEQIDAVIADAPQIVDQLKAEASANTASGAPAPVFVPVINAATTATDTLVSVMQTMRERIVSDMENLSRGSAETKRIEALGIKELDGAAEGTDAMNLGNPTGGSGGSSPTPGAGSGAGSGSGAPSGTSGGAAEGSGTSETGGSGQGTAADGNSGGQSRESGTNNASSSGVQPGERWG